jgi:hypothetical protein
LNTPAHLIFGAAAFSRPDRRGTFTASILGALAPDLSLYLMVSASLWWFGIPASTVFRELYYSDAWQAVFAVDNSIVLWGLALALARWRRSVIATAFAGAALLHLALDFPLHTHDARQHFWPLTDWVFESPVSYWDSRAHANIVGPIEVTTSMGLALLVFQRFRSWGPRLLIIGLAFAQVGSSGIWRFIF